MMRRECNCASCKLRRDRAFAAIVRNQFSDREAREIVASLCDRFGEMTTADFIIGTTAKKGN